MDLPAELVKSHPEISAHIEALTARLAALEKENAELHAQLAAVQPSSTPASVAGEFIEASGVLWKKKKSGSYESAPYCPTCKAPLSDYSGFLLCLKCNWPAPFKSFEVPRIYHELFGQQ